MDATLYNIKGEKAGKVNVPETLFGLPWNADLVHQVVVSMQSNARSGTAHTKTRGEVRGGGKKPWRQKGTGRARHGSSRSPIWVGGGVTHGPRADKNYSKKINRTMKQKALLVALSRKYKDGEVIFVDQIEMQAPKAAAAKEVLAALSKKGGFEALTAKRKNAALIALPNDNKPTQKSFANFGNVETSDVRNMNLVSLLSSKYVIIANPEASFTVLGAKKLVAKKSAK